VAFVLYPDTPHSSIYHLRTPRSSAGLNPIHGHRHRYEQKNTSISFDILEKEIRYVKWFIFNSPPPSYTGQEFKWRTLLFQKMTIKTLWSALSIRVGRTRESTCIFSNDLIWWLRIGTDCRGWCDPNYHTITVTTRRTVHSPLWVRVMVFNPTFNNTSIISYWSVLLVEVSGVARENHWPVADKLYHIMLLSMEIVLILKVMNERSLIYCCWINMNNSWCESLYTITIHIYLRGPSWLWSYGSWIYNYLFNQCLSPLMLWVWISIKARCTTLCDKVCQWLATGRWFSLGPPVSSTNKTDHYDITEILQKMALNTIKQTNIYLQPFHHIPQL
jgi:hypothetical protein